MQVVSPNQSEIRLTLEALVDIANALSDATTPGDAPDIRSMLGERGFSRAPKASAASIDRLGDRMHELRSLLDEIVDLDIAAAISRVNEELTELAVAPSVVDHGGVGPHLHWTASTATFDDQVIADVVMALAQELCENGISRFGRCAADDCDAFFYDGTRNRSRRFCSDPRCASRTHTADHRARKRRA